MLLHNRYASIFPFFGAPSSMRRRNAPPEKRKDNVINIFLVQCWRAQYHTPEEVLLIGGSILSFLREAQIWIWLLNKVTWCHLHLFSGGGSWSRRTLWWRRSCSSRPGRSPSTSSPTTTPCSSTSGMLLLSITAASSQGVGFHQTCSWMSSDASKLEFRFYSVEVVYPPGLEEMIGAFKFCATARLFLQVCTLHVCLKGHSRITFRVILTIKSL